MSCIVGLQEGNRVYVGCDSAGYAGDSKSVRGDRKMFRVLGNDRALIGFTTSYRMGQLLQYTEGLIPPSMKATHKNMVTKVVPRIMSCFESGGFIKTGEGGSKEGGQFLLAYRDKLFIIDEDFQVGINDCGYASVGCGAQYAMGSLHTSSGFDFKPEDRVRMALKAASVFGVGIEAPFVVMDTLSGRETVYDA